MIKANMAFTVLRRMCDIKPSHLIGHSKQGSNSARSRNVLLKPESGIQLKTQDRGVAEESTLTPVKRSPELQVGSE